MEKHESGCFFFKRNGIYTRKMPYGVKAIRIHMPNGRTVEGYSLGKVFYIDSEQPLVEVEMEIAVGKIEKRYFFYSNEEKAFVEC